MESCQRVAACGKRYLTRPVIRRIPGNRFRAPFDKRRTGPFYRFCPLPGLRRGPIGRLSRSGLPDGHFQLVNNSIDSGQKQEGS
jgi:hypothetical protein